MSCFLEKNKAGSVCKDFLFIKVFINWISDDKDEMANKKYCAGKIIKN